MFYPVDRREYQDQKSLLLSLEQRWPAVRNANPAFFFDPVSISTLKAKGIHYRGGFLGYRQPLDWPIKALLSHAGSRPE
jgi:hypothetical protein